MLVNSLSLLGLAGADAKHGIRCTPANQACEQQDCTNGAPPVGAHDTPADNGQANYNPENSVDTAYILFHFTPPLLDNSTFTVNVVEGKGNVCD
jgi:hypothetical protein